MRNYAIYLSVDLSSVIKRIALLLKQHSLFSRTGYDSPFIGYPEWSGTVSRKYPTEYNSSNLPTTNEITELNERSSYKRKQTVRYRYLLSVFVTLEARAFHELERRSLILCRWQHKVSLTDRRYLNITSFVS